MTRKMLIDATHPEETRVTVVDGNKLEEFDYETTTKAQLKGNIYLAKVTRVEPSLQAAFVDYGGNRHGFLAFSEIHPDYYRIPVSDREGLVDDEAPGDDDLNEDEAENQDGQTVEDMGGAEAVDEAVEEAHRSRPRLKRQYKIQEVIKRRQVLLVQVVKEERGNKGAALTTYLSLAGRYCVLMPNTSRGGGVSRKIANVQDRKRLKTIISELPTPDGMAVILRTAGAERSKAEIKRDFDYIQKLWEDIRQKTLASTAPALIHEEANLIKRSIRDLYAKDIDEILVAGEESYKTAKRFMRALMPSHSKKVQQYKDTETVPLFHRYQVEQQLTQIHDPQVQLRSGGTIVIHQTEALVAIDVNSGRATRERHIEETALKTNLEAAEEVARQLRLRDLAGLIVIDFIDMDDNRHAGQVERKLKDSLRRDRARIQVGRISAFGLMEMSRQRLRPSLLEAMNQPCPTCGGVGYIASVETAALVCLRAIEEEGLRKRSSVIKARVPTDVALYILNNKRVRVSEMEGQFNCRIAIEVDSSLLPPKFELTRFADDSDAAVEQVVTEVKAEPTPAAEDEGGNNNNNNKRRTRRGGRRRNTSGRDGEQDNAQSSRQAEGQQQNQTVQETPGPDNNGDTEDASGDEKGRRRRKRGRRGGRRRNRRPQDDQNLEAQNNSQNNQSAAPQAAGEGGNTPQAMQAEPQGEGERAIGEAAIGEGAIGEGAIGEGAGEGTPKPKRKTRSKRPSARKPKAADTVSSEAPVVNEAVQPPVQPPATPVESLPSEGEAEEKPAPKPRRRRATAKKKEAGEGNVEAAPSQAVEKEVADTVDAPKLKKARAKKSSAKKAPARKKASAKKPATKVADDTATPSVKTTEAPVEKPASQSAKEAGSMSKYVVSDGSESKKEKPKRKGWWNRMLG